MGAESCEASSLFKNCVPNIESGWKGVSEFAASALPGVTRSSEPAITTMKRSVVGSGPMRSPGKPRPRMYRMKEVLPTE